ncbi:hypothetical protein ACFP3U_31070 [Kitasatospora misakiensis]|uniref:Uncharacterized protein n=1 Tax=Kitasatospora misakiensis TaxID=67330 RepID=A0ABW0XC80_9ACTN
MRHFIVLALRALLRLVLPARGRHRRLRPLVVVCAPTEPVELAKPRRIICAPTRPVSVLDLRETVHQQPSSLAPAYLVAFERMTASQQDQARRRGANEMADRWAKIIEFELKRNADDQRRRRAALFAAALDLPDPEHWLDSITTGVPHTLAGKVA